MAFIVKRDGQGIPVDSVSGLEITFSDYGTHLFYKVTNSYFYNIDNDDNEYNLIWNFSTNRWLLSGRGVVATNLTSNSTTIPTTGWIYTTGSGVPIFILPVYGNNNVTGPLPARSIIIKKNTTFKIPRTGSGEPSGLPYSSTNSINLVDPTYSYQSGNYPKIVGYNNFTDDAGIITTNQFGQVSIITTYVPYFAFNVTTNRWEFGIYEDSLGEGTLVWSVAYLSNATNPSTNQNYIPTSGWSRNIVITAGA